MPWGFESVFEQDILEADFYGLKEAAGGTSARGEILLDNSHEAYSYTNAGPGTKVKVTFSLGDGLPYFERFVLYVDDNGIAQRAGLSVTDIDCSTIMVTLPFVRLTKNIWAELSSLATAYRVKLHCNFQRCFTDFSNFQKS
ncbi:hypothetical protein FACS189447_10810 [Spirochaetia bacterium]|nr:hypothetical protein FACS189447_10810 [Spirochaetia bacterium]